MRLRVLFITALLVGGFLYITSKTDWGRHRIFQPISHATGPIWSGPTAVRGAGLSSDEMNNIDIYKTAHLATVNITSTVYRRTFWEIYPAKDQGSGFLISDDGKILTNSHVVANEQQLEVTLSDQSRYKARLLSRDPANDVALLQISPRKKLPVLRLGDSDALAGGPEGAGDRQSIWAGRYIDHRYCEFAGTHHSRRERSDAGRADPNRCGD